MKHFLTLLGLDVNKTLCLTVGSPTEFKAKTPCFHATVFAWQFECVGRGGY